MLKFQILIIIFFLYLPLRVTAYGEYSFTKILQDSIISGDYTSDTIKLSYNFNRDIDTNNFNIFIKNPDSKKTALVLSGGGARGIAQLGVIKALEDYGIDFDLIVGTSIGTVIGGLYSSGYTVNEITDIIKEFNWERALSLTNKYQRTSLFLEQKKIQDRSLLTIPLDGIKPDILPSSFSNGQYLSEKINSLILNARYHVKKDFSDLKIPFISVATDLNKGSKVVLKKGNLSESIKASLTFPLLYTPINIGGKDLVDGGLSANIPTDIAREEGADFTIIVNSTSPLKSGKDLNDPINTADQILSITMMQLSNLQLKDANVVLTPDIKDHSATSYNDFDFLIRKGYSTVQENIEKLRKGIDSIEISGSPYINNFIINPVITVNTSEDLMPLADSIIDLSQKDFIKYTSIEKNLKSIYKSGFFMDVNAVIVRDGNRVNLRYNLVPYPLLKNVTVQNSGINLDKQIKLFVSENYGKPLNIKKLNDLRNELLGIMRDNDYSVKDISKFYFNYGTNTLEIEFDEGKIRSYKLSGNTITNDNVILRELKTDINKPIKSSDINLSLKNVMSTNLFQQVSFDYLFRNNKLKPDLLVRVVEKNSKALRFSVKADNEKNLQLLFDLRDENILGTALEAGILAAGGLRNRLYQIEIKSNQFFSLPLTFNLNGYYRFNDVYTYQQTIDTIENEYSVNRTGEYRTINYGTSFLFGTQLQRYGTFYVQGTAENQETKNKTNNESKKFNANVLKLKFGGIIDTENKLPFPGNGILLDFYYETAKNLNDGNLSYTKVFISYDHYLPVSRSGVLKPRFIFGFADKTTPVGEQFSMGGGKLFYGMSENELVGRQILLTSLEYRYLFPYKLFFDTYLSVRYDLGNVWENAVDIRFKDLRHGIGLSTGFDTPVGEASFAVGRSFLIKKGLQKDSFIFGPYNFYFSIGYDI